jgi:hypothetical protein
MKKTDIAMIILIASLGLVASYFIGNHFLGDAVKQGEKVKTIQLINATDLTVDPGVFSSDAINPTVQINITANGQ